MAKPFPRLSVQVASEDFFLKKKVQVKSGDINKDEAYNAAMLS
jgi:hypothetical protein